MHSTVAVQIAFTGVRYFGDTVASALEATGIPSSRENANSMREAEVTVARPQRNCAIRMPRYSRVFRPAGRIASIVAKNMPQPWPAATARSGIASVMAQIMIQPTSDDQNTAETMPAGTEVAADLVSSEVWAEAS